MNSAWQEILTVCSTNALARWNPDQPLEGAVTRCQQGSAAVIGHTLSSRPRPLCWLFSAQPVRSFSPWLEQLSSLLRKARLTAVRAFAKDLDIVYLPGAF